MGLGLYAEGSGIAATRFLVEAGAKVTVTDLKSAEQLAPQLKRLGALKSRIKLVLGEHREADFTSADLVVKNPGVPRTSKYLLLAQKNHIPIETDISLFFQLAERHRLIGITGTRGKSTTATLLYELLKPSYRQSILGGNITKSPLAQLKKFSRGGGWAVLELSSWMLESLEAGRLSPHLAIFTNIYPDHLNTYDGIKDYAAAKENIFRWQTPQDYLVISRDNAYTRAMGRRAVGQRFWFSLKEFSQENGGFVRGSGIYFRRDGRETKVLNLKKIQLPGQHNAENVLAAVTAAMIFGLTPKQISATVARFKGIPDRLELVRERRGVKYYNDTTSTMPEATLAALAALKSKKKKIILIVGGADKGLSFKKLAPAIKENCRALVFLPGSGSERLKKNLGLSAGPLVKVEAASMTAAVVAAQKLARSGEIVLLSPACASFGLFDNEFDRGRQFVAAVKKLN